MYVVKKGHFSEEHTHTCTRARIYIYIKCIKIESSVYIYILYIYIYIICDRCFKVKRYLMVTLEKRILSQLQPSATAWSGPSLPGNEINGYSKTYRQTEDPNQNAPAD